MKQQIEDVGKAYEALASIPYPSIGLDLDGTIDECPIFFKILASFWPGRVFVLTYRKDRQQAEADLQRFDIRYDELILVESFDAKAKTIEENGILTYFDDQPEMLKNVNPMVNVMLVRNEGNFDFDERVSMLSKQTGRLI